MPECIKTDHGAYTNAQLRSHKHEYFLNYTSELKWQGVPRFSGLLPVDCRGHVIS